MNVMLKLRGGAMGLILSCLILPQSLWAQTAVDEDPNAFAMAGDLLVARPVGLVMTAGGAAVWLVSLPFTLLSGHAGEAAEKLIVGPGEATFMRCLGCRNTGYTNKDVEAIQASREAEGE
jgi:hypothetical protein